MVFGAANQPRPLFLFTKELRGRAETLPMKTTQKRPWLGGGPILARISHGFCVASVIFFLNPTLRAQNPALPLEETNAGVNSNEPTSITAPYGHNNWASRWVRTLDKARAGQPHYVAPLISTHVLLVQHFRFDSYFQLFAGIWTEEYGGG